MYPMAEPHQVQEKTIRFVWNGDQQQLSKLVVQLKQMNLIKRQKDFFDLFDNPGENLVVKWNAKAKPHLAYLLYKLFAEGFCTIRGSKGYFTYAEQHFTDFEGNGLTPDTLKKLSSKINKFPDKYQDVRAVIDRLLEELY